jgi:hypothetical protein
MTAAADRFQSREAFEADILARAVSYSVHLRLSPTEKYTVPCESLEEAQRYRDEINEKLSRHGRRAVIYAISDDGFTSLIP